jgi:PIN domain nuclease of toxin-antitoxin system
VNLLLDTHTLLWFLDGAPQLSAAAKTHLQNTANQKFVSIASCWEIAIKVGSGKLTLGEPATTFLPRELKANNFQLLSIALPHCTMVETFPYHHRDPFDRLIVAQALIEGMTIVSSDAILDLYGVSRVWN